MIVVGLTGSIGMGKSTVAQMFVAEGVAVFDSDQAVHELYSRDGAAVAPVESAFPGVTRDGAIDRAELSRRVVGNEAAMKQLERIVHPMVREAQQRFFRAHGGEPVVLLDIPLLFETGRGGEVDRIVVVSAPPEVQRARVLARPGMSAEKFGAILARQTPDAEKRAHADFVIDTGVSLEQTRTQVRAVLDALREQD